MSAVLPQPALRMVRLALDAAGLARAGRAAALPPRQDDLGVLVHAALAGLFGEGAVQPFRVLDETARQVPVLGYTSRGDEELRSHAAAFADPALYAACAWEGLASKPLPELAAGRRLGFELRACPVVRLAGGREVSDKEGKLQPYRAGVEVDAWAHRRFLARETEAVLDREAAYADWLRARMGEAATIETVRLHGFRRLRLVRRGHSSPRQTRVLERPEALLMGNLEVRDATAFHQLLARGLGRHRAFGFGMLLLRPPAPC
jgi:CRISPR system Cascade subunit CasE